MVGTARAALHDIDSGVPLLSAFTLKEHMDFTLNGERARAQLTSAFAVLGLVLAATGLYGVLAYMVERRRGEIGVRMALGADRGRVIGMVLGGAFLQVAVGLAVGLPAAIGAGKLMSTQLFGVSPSDPVMLLLATLLLSLAALVASVVPAWRAAGIEPMMALRTE